MQLRCILREPRPRVPDPGQVESILCVAIGRPPPGLRHCSQSFSGKPIGQSDPSVRLEPLACLHLPPALVLLGLLGRRPLLAEEPELEPVHDHLLVRQLVQRL